MLLCADRCISRLLGKLFLFFTLSLLELHLHKFLKLVCRHRLSEEEALRKVAARLFEYIHLTRSFDALGDGLYLLGLCNSYNSRNDLT